MGCLSFFPLIKNYAETTLLIDEKIISQEAFYAVQQSLRRVKSPKICINCLKERFCVLYSKITFIDYQVKTFSLIQLFRDTTLLEICWAV